MAFPPRMNVALVNGVQVPLDGLDDAALETYALDQLPLDQVPAFGDASWYRQDGTPKSNGFLGVLPIPGTDDVATEYTIADSEALRSPTGKYLDYPTLVPTLTPVEVQQVLHSARDRTPLPQPIKDKAEAFALQRRAEGKSFFADPTESPAPIDQLPLPRTPVEIPAPTPQFEELHGVSFDGTPPSAQRVVEDLMQRSIAGVGGTVAPDVAARFPLFARAVESHQDTGLRPNPAAPLVAPSGSMLWNTLSGLASLPASVQAAAMGALIDQPGDLGHAAQVAWDEMLRLGHGMPATTMGAADAPVPTTPSAEAARRGVTFPPVAAAVGDFLADPLNAGNPALDAVHLGTAGVAMTKALLAKGLLGAAAKGGAVLHAGMLFPGVVRGVSEAAEAKRVAEIKALFPRLDAYTKKTAPISAKVILKRLEATPDLSRPARRTLENLATHLGDRRIMADELHALVQGEDYRPDRMLRKVAAVKEGAEQIKGAPLGVTTARQEKAIREKYLAMLEVGMGGRDWYIDAGGAVKFYANDDPLRARRLAEDLAITSSGTSTAMGKTIAEVHAPGEAGVTGLKRTPFADNMARGGGFLEKDAPARAVHDIWEGEAFGYVNPDGSPLRRGFTPSEHAWMDKQTDRIIQEANERALGGHTDWNEANTQAAAWIGAKVKAGQMTADDAAKSYASYFEDLAAQGSREVTPGRTTAHMSELLRTDAEAAQFRQLLHELVMGESGVYDALGRDQIAAAYGGLVGKSFDAPGVYEGQVTPGRQTRVLTGSEELKDAAGKSQGRVLDEGSRRILNAAESTWALLTGQDAAAYSRLLPAGPGVPRTAWDVTLPGGTATRVQVEALVQKLGSAAKDAILVPTPDGIRLANLDDAMLKAVTKDLGGTVKERGVLQGNYIGNDWQTQRVGQSYLEPIREMGTEKFDAFAPQLAQRLRDIDKKFAQMTGGKVTLSPIMDELRAAVAKDGFAGLERLATKYAIPVALLAAALAALQVPGSARGANGDGRS